MSKLNNLPKPRGEGKSEVYKSLNGQGSPSVNKTDNPLSPRNLLAGFLVSIVGGIALAWIIQDARFQPQPDKKLNSNTSQETHGDCSSNIRDSSGIVINCNTVINGQVVGNQKISTALLRDKVSYFVNSVQNSPFDALRANINGQDYELISEEENLCLDLTDQRDYDKNGSVDALVTNIVACGGNGTGNSFFFISYLGDGHFERSSEFGGISWSEPEIQEWKGVWSVVTTSANEGMNTDAPIEIKERFVLDAGNAVKVEESERKEIIALVELKSEDFDFQKIDEVKEILFDLDGDGIEDKIIGRLWHRWGRVVWSVSFSQGGGFESSGGCKRVGILSTTTVNVHDIVCDHDTIYRWNGNEYISQSS